MAPRQYFKKICATCGSEDVLCDAYAEWDVVAQAWSLQNTFDKGAYCNTCDGETRIESELITRKNLQARVRRALRWGRQ
jgi:hypothetical protein